MGQLVSEILNMLNENAITVYSILFILVVFGYYLGQALKIRRAILV